MQVNQVTEVLTWRSRRGCPQVIFFTDAVDEYLMQNLTEYDDKKFQNASKDDLKLKGDKAREKKVKETFKSLMSWWKEELGSTAVEAVKVSNRLADTPCVVVTSKYGWSANMERIMSAQALSDSSKQSYMKGRKTLEINPRHPIIKQLREMVEKNKEVQHSPARPFHTPFNITFSKKIGLFCVFLKGFFLVFLGVCVFGVHRGFHHVILFNFQLLNACTSSSHALITRP